VNARTARQFPLVVALALALALVPAAFAAKGGGSGGGKPGGGGGGSSLSLQMVTDTGTAGVSYGDTVTFNVSTSASYPSVQLVCYQNGTLVFAQTAGFFPTYVWSKNYTLGGDRWPGGAANCTATLYYTTKNGTNSTLASLSFVASA
jgi:hypothetical protein